MGNIVRLNGCGSLPYPLISHKILIMSTTVLSTKVIFREARQVFGEGSLYATY
jgi:hypothetical protein